MTNVKTDKQGIRAAFKQLRSEGFIARMGINEMPDAEDGANVVWYDRKQNEHFNREGNIERVVFLNWEGDVQRIIEVLKEHGMEVDFKGKFHHAIELFSERTK